MSSDPSRIAHVSDTALMTAAIRAMETDSPNGWIRDPYAERLAGSRGMEIARSLPGIAMMRFGVGMRSRILDDMVSKAISAHNIRTFLCLGAGLDTRPWRLELPTDLNWLEVDLPPMLEYKSAILADEPAKCHLARLAADLNDATQRKAVFDSIGAVPAMMMTEGLLMYLPRESVAALAADAATAGVRYWLADLATNQLRRAIGAADIKDVEAVRASDSTDGEEIAEILRRAGWNSLESQTYSVAVTQLSPPGRLEEMARLRPDSRGGPPQSPPADDISGVHLFGRL
jgi:methyltransferase (TIGR00027 family)